MPKVVSTPFLTAPSGSVRVLAWTLPDGNPLPEEWSGWDPTVDIRVSVAIELDVEDVLRGCQLEIDPSYLTLSTFWRSGGTSLRGRGQVHRLTDNAPDRIVLDLAAPGSDLMGDVELRVQLVLGLVPEVRTPLSPWRAGSILWSDTRKILLGGRGGRFPIEWTAFSDSGQFHAGSGWQLDWDPDDLDVPALAGIRLYLNSESENLALAVESEGSDPLLPFMHFDVARTLITGVLENPELGTGERDPESVG
jgi:hypothetical protein